MGHVLKWRFKWLTSVRSRWFKRKLYNVKDSPWWGDRRKLEGRREKELLYHQLSYTVNSIIIHLLRQRFPQVLYLFLYLFIPEILISRYSICQKPNFFTHSLQIYCIRLIGLVSQSYWVWAPNSDPTIYINI